MNVVIVGARKDGHARVVADAILAGKEYTLVGFVDDDASLKGQKILGHEVLGTTAVLGSIKGKFDAVIVAVGDNHARKKLGRKLKKDGLKLASVRHPTAIIANDVKLGEGAFVAAGAIINSGTAIGEGAIINTGATVDHDNLIGDYAHVAPGVHTAGRVKIGECAFLGIGSKVIPDIEIGRNAVVGAGAVVLENVPDNATCVGVPAKVIKINKEVKDE